MFLFWVLGTYSSSLRNLEFEYYWNHITGLLATLK